MKRKKNSNFNYFLVMTIFTVCYLVTFILSSKTISMGKLIATAGATIYPVTYFISTLFCERYGKKHSLLMIIYTVTALVIATILIAIATALPIYCINRRIYNWTITKSLYLLLLRRKKWI